MSKSVLKFGSRHAAEVSTLQQKLLNLGYLKLPSDVDGKFGLETKDAVLNYQRDKGLTADGVVGIKTAAALDLGALPDANVDYKKKAPIPTRILTDAQRESIANKLDALIPTGPLEMIDGPAIRWIVDGFEHALIKLIPSEWIDWLQDINKGLATQNEAAREKLIARLNKNINIWQLSEKIEEKIISFLVDFTISALSLGGDVDKALERVAKQYT